MVDLRNLLGVHYYVSLLLGGLVILPVAMNCTCVPVLVFSYTMFTNHNQNKTKRVCIAELWKAEIFLSCLRPRESCPGGLPRSPSLPKSPQASPSLSELAQFPRACLPKPSRALPGLPERSEAARTVPEASRVTLGVLSHTSQPCLSNFDTASS